VNHITVMIRFSRHCLALSALLSPAMTCAHRVNTDADARVFTVGGVVPPLCQIGGSAQSRGSFDLGILTVPATAYLRRDLAAPDKELGDTWCNGPSQIEISAVELTPQGSVVRLRDGFARAVHFTATARGWTAEPATFRTDRAGLQSAAIQQANRPRVTILSVGLSDFRMIGGNTLRPVASRTYLGAVVVTLKPLP
jgi:hypothetical protein